MKFSVFADLHHHPGVFDGGTYEELEYIQRRAEENSVSFIIHAGDFCHGPSLCPDYVKAYNGFHIPSYHCLGNHDSDSTSYAETLKAYNMPDGHYYFDCEGYRFIVCDPNYYLLDGEYVHYDLGNYYMHGNLRDYMPPDQLEWLERTIDEANVPCILISHESFEREADGVRNLDKVREIFNRCNAKRKNAVLMCINGHYHRDNLRILDGILYFDLNSASFDWVGNVHECYPRDLCEKICLLNHTVVYNDPIHAIITLEGTTVTIDGMESSMFMGINRAETGVNPIYDAMGRPVCPRVQSAKVTVY
ncbi:MAG: metallophosphoesterase [Clostridia bacterium]|nr:metallophosphoesterase [Clostridia bacterium]